MNLAIESHQAQELAWPSSGRHILAHYDETEIVVYQAYRPSIGQAAAADNAFGGGGFSFDRMSWVKPNFLWMMYRSGWGTKPGQEVVLAVHLARAFFDEILAAAVPSSFDPQLYADHDAWQAALASSDVRLQWDPDHAPRGAKLERRAIQLGLRGAMLRRYGSSAIVEIEDVSEFVAEGRRSLEASGELVTPRERVYRPASAATAARLGLATG